MKRASLAVLSLVYAGWSLAQPTRPAAPAAWVTDEAGLFAPDARDRVAARLKKIKQSSSFLRIYVYALKSANGLPLSEAMQELYRRWRMRERESGDGLATHIRMTSLPDRNGVLILVDPAFRTFLVWGDAAVHERLGPGFFKEAADSIAELFRKRDFTGGLRHGIETVGRALAEHYPKEGV